MSIFVFDMSAFLQSDEILKQPVISSVSIYFVQKKKVKMQKREKIEKKNKELFHEEN